MDEKPIAHLFGEPIIALPHGLFIPPDALQIILAEFSGPLDLLLYLIRKQNLDILNIPLVLITKQYLVYIEKLDSLHFDLVAEYLLMAGVLLEIKSRMLLPQIKVAENEEDDPRAELMQRLLEYEQIKLAAETLNFLPQAGRDFMWVGLEFEKQIKINFPSLDVEVLQMAWLTILNRRQHFESHQLNREPLSIKQQMTTILNKLQASKWFAFYTVFESSAAISLVVVTFIAMLELIKEGKIEVMQQYDYAEVFLKLAK